MRLPCKSSVLLVVLSLLLVGCGAKQSEESPKTESAKPATPSAAEPQAAPATAAAKPAAASAEPAKPAAAAAKSEAASTRPEKSAVAAPANAEAASTQPAQPAVATSSPTPAPVAAPVAKERKAAPKDVAILKGAALGGVKFEHKLHVERAGNKCATCHHASRPEKPGTAAQEGCLDCHTRPPAPGMKTGLPAAFHNAAAQAGACIDCHKAQNAQGKKAPTKCVDCHRKENT